MSIYDQKCKLGKRTNRQISLALYKCFYLGVSGSKGRATCTVSFLYCATEEVLDTHPHTLENEGVRSILTQFGVAAASVSLHAW
jgi:hypothetical protein